MRRARRLEEQRQERPASSPSKSSRMSIRSAHRPSLPSSYTHSTSSSLPPPPRPQSPPPVEARPPRTSARPRSSTRPLPPHMEATPTHPPFPHPQRTPIAISSRNPSGTCRSPRSARFARSRVRRPTPTRQLAVSPHLRQRGSLPRTPTSRHHRPPNHQGDTLRLHSSRARTGRRSSRKSSPRHDHGSHYQHLHERPVRRFLVRRRRSLARNDLSIQPLRPLCPHRPSRKSFPRHHVDLPAPAQPRPRPRGAGRAKSSPLRGRPPRTRPPFALARSRAAHRRHGSDPTRTSSIG